MSSHVKLYCVLSTRDAETLRLALQMADFKKRVGERIRAARDAKGWTQAELARALPPTVDGASVSRWERGDVMPEQHLEALAQALDVDAGYFLAPDPAPGAADLIGTLSGATQLDRIEAKLDELLELTRDADGEAVEAELDDAPLPTGERGASTG